VNAIATPTREELLDNIERMGFRRHREIPIGVVACGL
jgi:hypothetical protein